MEVRIFLAQQTTTKTNLRCFKKPGPDDEKSRNSEKSQGKNGNEKVREKVREIHEKLPKSGKNQIVLELS